MSVSGTWKIASTDPDRTAVVAVDGSRTSYAALAAHSNQLAHGMAAIGLKVAKELSYQLYDPSYQIHTHKKGNALR